MTTLLPVLPARLNTGDGLINIAANKQEQFEAVCDVVGRSELKEDPRFTNRQSRLEHRRGTKRTFWRRPCLQMMPEPGVINLMPAGVPAGLCG